MKKPLLATYPRLALKDLLLRIVCHSSLVCSVCTACNGGRTHARETLFLAPYLPDPMA